MPHFQNRYRFARVSHSEEIANIARRNIEYGTGDLFTTIVGLDDGVSVAEALIKDGYEVIIGQSGTGGMIAESIGYTIRNFRLVCFREATSFFYGLNSNSESLTDLKRKPIKSII